MMRWNGFAGSLVFAAVAAAAMLVVHPVLASSVGAFTALRLFVVGLAPLYLVGLAPSWRAGLAAAVAASGLGLVVLGLPLGLPATILAAAVVLACCRSGILYRQRSLRALLTEGVLLAAGLAFAGFLVGDGLATFALAVWGYLLVQSTFFLVGGVRPRAERANADPFDRARTEIIALLEP